MDLAYCCTNYDHFLDFTGNTLIHPGHQFKTHYILIHKNQHLTSVQQAVAINISSVGYRFGHVRKRTWKMYSQVDNKWWNDLKVTLVDSKTFSVSHCVLVDITLEHLDITNKIHLSTTTPPFVQGRKLSLWIMWPVVSVNHWMSGKIYLLKEKKSASIWLSPLDIWIGIEPFNFLFYFTYIERY